MYVDGRGMKVEDNEEIEGGIAVDVSDNVQNGDLNGLSLTRGLSSP